MSTATITNANHPPTSTPPTIAILRRFVWKEYRTLRALWLAVLALGIIEQALSALFAPSGINLPAWLFGSALTAATVYAVGAAAVMFAVEHEEETYGFLTGLPSTWQPIFAGKLLVATVTAFALAATLSLFSIAFTGRFDTGPRLPSVPFVAQLLGIFGLAILEAIAWGTFFSLLVKRPLVAALLTIIVGSLVVHLAVNFSNQSSFASNIPQAYVHAAPLRLALIGGVLLASLAAARTWLLPPKTRSRDRAQLSDHVTARRGASATSSLLSPVADLVDRFWTTNTYEKPYSRRRAFARLLWQSWRESWRMLLLPILVAAFLVIGLAAAIGFLFGGDESVIYAAATLFFAPALYGALAFHADQRRANYRFLAEHAARPRFVWLSRHLLWLGALLLLLAAITLGLISAGIFGIRHNAHEVIENRWQNLAPGITTPELWTLTSTLLAGSALTWLGAIAAYAIGQFFSMLFRSEILAAFISLLLAVVLSAWAATLYAWELSAWMFLVPIAVGFLVATWLRAPDWIAERHSLRAWLPPLLAIFVPLALIAIALPQVRLDQLPANADEAVTLIVDRSELFTPLNKKEAAKTAALYIKAVTKFDSWRTSDLLDRWSKPEYMEPLGGSLMSGELNGAYGMETGGIDASKIPPAERDAYFQAIADLGKLQAEAQEKAIALAVEASRRPTCFFDVNWSGFSIRDNYAINDDPWTNWQGADPIYRQLLELVTVVANSGDTPESAIDHQIAALRMCDHLREGQPTAVAVKILEVERHVLEQIAQWAMRDIPTQEDRRSLLEKLATQFQSRPNPAAALLADRELVNNAITGKTLPLVLSDPTSAVRLAYFANSLPWERERSLRAINLVTAANIHKTTGLFYDKFPDLLQGGASQWAFVDPAILTSYFARMEYDARVPLHRFFRALTNTETVRRATLIRVALAIYHEDHDDYPAALIDLAPKYLPNVPNDPYSYQPFNYSPRGLDLPLRLYSSTDRDQVASETPLFWSIGHDSSQLTRQKVSLPTTAEDTESRSEDVYFLMNAQSLYYNPDPALVFPLTKE